MGCSSSKDCTEVDRTAVLGSDPNHMHSVTPPAANESRATPNAARAVRRRAARCPASAQADEQPRSTIDAPLSQSSEQPRTQRHHRGRPSSNGGNKAAANNSTDNGPTSNVWVPPTPTASEQKKRSQEALRRRVQRDLQQSAVEMDRMFRDHFGAGSLSLSAGSTSTPTSARSTAEQQQR